MFTLQLHSQVNNVVFSLTKSSAYLSQNAYFGGFYVLEKPPALSWYYARAVASSLFSRYRHVSQYTWVDYSAADGRTVVSEESYLRVYQKVQN